jgi:hypothetical protein
MNPSDFKQHPVFDRLSDLKKSLQSKAAREHINLDSLNYLQTSMNYIADRLNCSIPILIQDSELNAIAQDLTNELGQINAFLGNSNSGHLINAINNVNASLSKIRNLPSQLIKGNSNYSKILSNFDSLVRAKLDFLNNENKSLKNQISLLGKDLEKSNQELKKLSNSLLQKEKEIQNLNNNFQTDFKNFRLISTQNIEKDRITFRKEFDKDKEKYRKDIDEKIELLDSSSAKIISELKLKLKDARKLVNVIGNVGATGNFQVLANYHNKEANKWRIVAISFMSILSLILIITIWDIHIGNFDWVRSVVRIFAAGILSYPATYAAQESSKHRRQENYNRKIELELASINPFIEILEEPKKQIIKEKLVDKYFGNNDTLDSKEDVHDSTISLNAVEKIIRNIGSIINKQ